MMRTPSSKAACASGLVFGSATGAIGLTAAAPGLGGCAHPAVARTTASPTPQHLVLLITSNLFDAIERDARLAGAAGQTQLGLLGVLVLREARERLPDRLGVLVVDADLERAGVARLVGVDRLVLDDDDDLLELVAVHLLLVFLEVLWHRRAAHGLGVGLVALADAQERGGRPFG